MHPRFSEPSHWGRRMKDLVDRIQRRIPANVTPEEVEADITAARAELREARSTQRKVIGTGQLPTPRDTLGCD